MNWKKPSQLKKLEKLTKETKVPGQPGTYFLSDNTFAHVAKDAIPQLIEEIRRLRRSL